MLNSYFNRLVLISAGLGFGAFAYSAATMSGADLLRAFVVHFGGGLAVATPIALASVFIAKNATANSVFYAGLILGISPWLAALVPLPLALSCALVLAIAAIMFGRGSQAANQVSLFAYASSGVFALLVIAGLWMGGAIGRQPLVNVLPERDDPIPTTPDVLLISVDTLRADIFVDPPAGLDFKTVQMMARRGISAPYALSSSSVTLPGHTTMLTGLDSLDHGVRDNFDPIPDGLPWLAKDFKKSGYHTAGVISNGLLSRDIGFGEGFEIYDDSEVPLRGDIRKFVDAIANSSWIGAAFAPSKLLKALDKPLFRAYRTHKNKAERGRAARTNKHALGFVDQLIEHPRPYFFFLHYLDPHDPYGTVAPYDMLLEQGRSSMAPVEVEPNHGVMGDTAIMVEKMLQSNDAQQREDAKPMIDFMVRRYIEEMLFTDEAIGEVLSKIEDSGRETIVILTSDHGEHFGEHDLMKHGNSLYQENLRVPFFMYGPGIPEGLRTDQQIQLLDIAPTLYDLCDIDSDANLRGVNIVDLAQSNEIIEREHIAIDGNFFSIRIGNKKYIARWDDRLGLVLGDGLGYFDLDADGNEMKASDDIPAKFRDAIDEALDRDTYQVDAIKSGFQADMGHQLGYTGE